ncbi:uncharacterized protein BYT42DRAFT_111699 [Radiomyces spectabilis]|uniref:uncharacterized protein n=1 Tax=Radiomyces spectabilis TaxID=64574 RepID=UPI00221E3D66|nr:uncharacterized protein BYT42DRAFT_111699 [Radiomyces spectabilis]KAI8369473.1 hypothetical protein BYT42DRAFT_111699 [Radiomyces spectabilis]
MTSHYLYKNQYDKALIYADCEWINNVDLSQDDPTLTICRLTLTDTKAFWTGSVTRGDLRSFENSGVSPILLSRVIQAALQGAKEAQGQKMDWKTMPKKSTCEVNIFNVWTTELTTINAVIGSPYCISRRQLTGLSGGILGETSYNYGTHAKH